MKRKLRYKPPTYTFPPWQIFASVAGYAHDIYEKRAKHELTQAEERALRGHINGLMEQWDANGVTAMGYLERELEKVYMKTMKPKGLRVIIAGSRDMEDGSLLVSCIAQSGLDIREVVSGGCFRGVDLLGERWAKARKIPIAPFPADWLKHGRAAGPIRNSEMARYADALIALWDGESTGTKDMIDKAKAKKLKVVVFTVKGRRIWVERSGFADEKSGSATSVGGRRQRSSSGRKSTSPKAISQRKSGGDSRNSTGRRRTGGTSKK